VYNFFTEQPVHRSCTTTVKKQGSHSLASKKIQDFFRTTKTFFQDPVVCVWIVSEKNTSSICFSNGVLAVFDIMEDLFVNMSPPSQAVKPPLFQLVQMFSKRLGV